MYNKIIVLSIAVMMGMIACEPQQQTSDQSDQYLENYQKQEISAQDLSAWDFWGYGKAFDAGRNQFCLIEDDSTAGVILISPDSYSGDVIVRYKTLALTSSTVLVAMHSVSDKGNGEDLNVPDDYDGGMGLWIGDKDNYFYAFRNEPHNFTPFIRKYPVPGGDALVSAEENFMLPGKYYDIEIGRINNRLWLKVDGEEIIEAVDDEILPGGHIALRIRGTAGLKAACLIKDMEIYSAN